MAREHLFPKVRAGSDRPSLSDVPVFKPVTMAWVTVQLEVGGVVCLPHYSTRAESGGAVVLGRKSRFCSQKGMLGWPRMQEQECGRDRVLAPTRAMGVTSERKDP